MFEAGTVTIYAKRHGRVRPRLWLFELPLFTFLSGRLLKGPRPKSFPSQRWAQTALPESFRQHEQYFQIRGFWAAFQHTDVGCDHARLFREFFLRDFPFVSKWPEDRAEGWEWGVIHLNPIAHSVWLVFTCQ